MLAKKCIVSWQVLTRIRLRFLDQSCECGGLKFLLPSQKSSLLPAPSVTFLSSVIKFSMLPKFYWFLLSSPLLDFMVHAPWAFHTHSPGFSQPLLHGEGAPDWSTFYTALKKRNFPSQNRYRILPKKYFSQPFWYQSKINYSTSIGKNYFACFGTQGLFLWALYILYTFKGNVTAIHLWAAIATVNQTDIVLAIIASGNT